jgi:chromosomal replication initiator protein
LPENRSALAAVRRVAGCLGARRPERSLHPLFLHGPPGTGKSHLAAALLEEVVRQAPDAIARVVAARDLLAYDADTDELQAGRQCDLLVIEDLQHLPARAAETLVQLFDHLHVRQRQLVFTATAGPRELTELPARLTSRLACGLVVGMEALAAPSRLLLLQAKAQRRQLALGPDVLAWLARHLAGGGRQLEGALARLETLARMQARPLDVATVADHFREQAEAGRPTVARIAERVAECFRVAPRQMQSRRRYRSLQLPRQVGMYLSRQLTGLSLQQIGAYFGGRDHSTVLHACHKVEEVMAQDASLSGVVRQLRGQLA